MRVVVWLVVMFGLFFAEALYQRRMVLLDEFVGSLRSMSLALEDLAESMKSFSVRIGKLPRRGPQNREGSPV